MKMILFLLLALGNGFAGMSKGVQLPAAKPKVKMVYSNRLFDLATRGLAVERLRKVYGKTLRVSKISRNIHEPDVRDTLLVAVAGADRLRIFSNKYKSFLLSAEISSQKLKFGQGIRVGSTKTAFCNVFGLPATFNGYQLADAEGRSSIYFLFRRGVLVLVDYEIGWLD